MRKSSWKEDLEVILGSVMVCMSLFGIYVFAGIFLK